VAEGMKNECSKGMQTGGKEGMKNECSKGMQTLISSINGTNGRRRKVRICSLDIENGTITDKDITQHIVSFDKQLFGASMHKGAHLDAGFCSEEEQLCAVERDLLICPFSEKVSGASNS
jgi:hypothetical protein